MFFLQPLFLLLVVFPFLLFYYSFTSKRQTLASIFSPEVLEVISLNGSSLSSALKYRLFLLSILLFIISLAQPVSNHASFNKQEKSIALVIALDISKSMLQDDLYPSRLSLALSKIKSIMNSNVNLRVGLLLFGDNAYVAHPLSEDKASLLFIANNIDYSKIMESKTNLFAVLEGATIMLKNYKQKNLLILSDISKIQSFKEEALYIKDNNLSVTLLEFTKESKSLTYSQEDINTILNSLQKSAQTQVIQGNTRLKQLFIYPLALALFLLLFIYAYGLELKNKSINLLVSLLVLSFAQHAQASLLDFQHVSNANEMYKEGHYEESIQTYIKIIGDDDRVNAKVYYNIANAYAKMGQLRLAKKYYLKSLALVRDIEAEENLAQVKKILSNQKHKKSKDKEEKYKLPQRISIERKSPQETLSSDYVVTLDTIVLSQEAKLLKKLKQLKPIIFLRKLHITKRSKNVLQD